MSTRPAPRMPAHRVDLLSYEGLAEHDVQQVTSLLGRLVDGGAALGWVTAPTTGEIGELVERLAAGIESGETAVAIARRGDEITGFAFLGPVHPTHLPTSCRHRKGRGRSRGSGPRRGEGADGGTHHAARHHGTEVVTLDLRGDNKAAIGLYESLGFTRYGRLPDFVAVGQERFDAPVLLDLRR